ncbi:helix-turn-helix domain-containing protein [Providencia alcalifaciens]|uniref:helix-turn-helix domain-containing protein n=2 Tax=Providencia TaxID=586 RepID=UPI001E37592B|nr:helix-turn-helix transcriptional regulator [Providencia alcalifaciens]
MITTEDSEVWSLQMVAGHLIRDFRQEIGMSESELAHIMGISQQQISRYERGVCDFTLSYVDAFAAAFGLTLRQFMDKLFESLYIQGAMEQNIPPIFRQNTSNMEQEINAIIDGLKNN